MAATLSNPEFDALFKTFELSARRWEARSRYDVEQERSELRKFLAGELPPRYERVYAAWWAENRRRKTAAGQRFERVRVMDDPLTDYNRYMVYAARHATGNGEDARFISRRLANELDLPDHDFWVFDSITLVLMRFTADDRSLGHDVISDPELVARHEAWIDVAMAHSTRYRDYIAEDPTREVPPIRLAGEVTAGGR
jgi:hypothetical protein